MNRILYMVIASLTLALAGCNRVSDAPIFNERANAENKLRAFKQVLAGMTLQQQREIVSVEQLYAKTFADDSDLEFFTWDFVEGVGGRRFSYLVFPMTTSPREGQVFISTPCSVKSSANRDVRLVLMQDLEVQEMPENEFHGRIAMQYSHSGKE